MNERFPSVETDDIIQETLIALIKSFPAYRYSPEEKGSFHNYLTGILRHRALRALQVERQEEAVVSAAAEELRNSRDTESNIGYEDEGAWRHAIFEIALQQLLADESILARTRQVFMHVAVNGERPEDVASAFGITRNAVDQIKSRLMARLRELVAALEKADGIHAENRDA